MKYKYCSGRNVMPDGKKSVQLTCYECKEPQVQSYYTEDGKSICPSCKIKDEKGLLS